MHMINRWVLEGRNSKIIISVDKEQVDPLKFIVMMNTKIYTETKERSLSQVNRHGKKEHGKLIQEVVNSFGKM